MIGAVRALKRAGADALKRSVKPAECSAGRAFSFFALYGFRSEDRSSEGAHHLIVLRYDHRAPQFILKGPPNRLIGGNTSLKKYLLSDLFASGYVSEIISHHRLSDPPR